MFVKTHLVILLASICTLCRTQATYKLSNIPANHLLVCLSVCPVHCGKTADHISMRFGMVGRTDPGMRQVFGFRDRSAGRGNFRDEYGASGCRASSVL